MRRTGILIVGHGSRDGGANAELEDLVARFQARRPELRVALGYVELAHPTLAEGLAALAAEVDEVLAVPLFLFTARHVKNDIPLALEAARREFPGVRFSSARALG